MQKIIKEDLEIERETLSREEAEEFFEENESTKHRYLMKKQAKEMNSLSTVRRIH